MENEKIIKTLFVDCKDARLICDKAQYKEATVWEIFKLQFHNLFCKYCSKHTAKNTKLTSLCSGADLNRMDKDTKEKMKNLIDLELKKPDQ